MVLECALNTGSGSKVEGRYAQMEPRMRYYGLGLLVDLQYGHDNTVNKRTRSNSAVGSVNDRVRIPV